MISSRYFQNDTSCKNSVDLLLAILCVTSKIRINRNAALQLVWHCLGRTKADSLPDYLHPELSRNANRLLISHSDHGKKRYDLSHYAVNFRSTTGTAFQVTKVPFLPPKKFQVSRGYYSRNVSLIQYRFNYRKILTITNVNSYDIGKPFKNKIVRSAQLTSVPTPPQKLKLSKSNFPGEENVWTVCRRCKCGDNHINQVLNHFNPSPPFCQLPRRCLLYLYPTKRAKWQVLIFLNWKSQKVAAV